MREIDATRVKERNLDIATAELAVVEKLRWWLAGSNGALAGQYWESWWIGVLVGVAVFFLVTHGFEKEYDKANDAYDRATGTGRYYVPKEIGSGDANP